MSNPYPLIFPELTSAEIETKKIMLAALVKTKKDIEPLLNSLSVEISTLEDEIERLQDKLNGEGVA